MRKIEKRSVFCLILAALLGIGLAFFCFRFVADGDDWASYPYNRHLYNNSGVLKGGTIIDSRGVVLSTLSEDGERVYNEDGTIRRATLHAVGDPAGNIGAGALTAFADKLSGYNLLTGAYSPLGTGNSVYLTIDSELNRVAYEALGGQSGTVGVYNYKTGEILCMVSTPTFDPADPPNIAADDPAWDGVYVNRLLSANSIPGSIFKVVTLNAAIENIPDLFQRKWNCTGSVEIGGDVVTCPYAHGEQDIEAALANSCNGVFGQLAVELGAETMKKYTDAAGLTESLRVDGIQTASGHFDFDVSENQLAWAGVGQGQDTMCPISMLQYMGAIANGGKAAVQDLSLHIRPGEICAFIGHNGAGKTTTLKCCCGIQQFDSGRITVDGISVQDDPLECKRRLAYLPDNPDLYEYMTGIQYLNFIADIFAVGARERAERIRSYGDQFDLTQDLAQPISAYSHGMKQKLAIISALLHEPKLILMDEPFVGLDPLAAHQLKTLMRRFCDGGGAIFFSTHVLEVAEKLCDRVAIIRAGRLVRAGSMDEVRGDDSLEEVFLELEGTEAQA